MSDLFHEDVPDYFIKKIFNVMNYCPQHTFQVLTKRSHRLSQMSGDLRWTHNIWMGVSIENDQMKFRIRDLLKTDAPVKFLSCEPLIGPIRTLPLKGIDWVIVGGESGPKARRMNREWAVLIRDQCLAAGVPYFFKQWGGVNKKTAGRTLDGRTWNDMPPPFFSSSIAHQSI
jgi:protein gp37